jgi:hypothetical protein
MIPKRPAPDVIRGGYRFPACAKPRQPLAVSFNASAGEARSKKIMLKYKTKLPITIAFSFCLAAAAVVNWTFAPLDDFGDDGRICGESCDRLGAPLRLAMFADSARP